MSKWFHGKVVLRCFASASVVVYLSGCNILPERVLDSTSNNQQNLTLCENNRQENAFAEFCDAQYWISYQLSIQNMAWQERSDLIKSLSDDAFYVLQKSLLSQAVDTPYQDRLRAQNWLLSLQNLASDKMNSLLLGLIYNNSQQLLELESAITVLSRVNTQQAKKITKLEKRLGKSEEEILKQQEQVDQLLKIELDISKKNKQSLEVSDSLDLENNNDGN